MVTAKGVVSVSTAILMGILSEMGVLLSELEIGQLYRQLLTHFGLIGALNECQALENAWEDPYNRHVIEEFIRAWLNRRREKREETITGVV